MNCNQELAEVLGCPIGEEKLEFHQAVYRLKDHLHDVPPLELNFEINLNALLPKANLAKAQPDTYFYELPVYEHGGNHRE